MDAAKDVNEEFYNGGQAAKKRLEAQKLQEAANLANKNDTA